MNSTPYDYIPIVLMAAVALGFVVITMLLTHLLGPQRKSQVKLEPFECGIESQQNARLPFSVKYFLIAMLFVLFDVEVIYMYPWAVNFREGGMEGFLEMLVFIGILLAGYLYIMRKGALRWE
jgi:NADH-quinone oxidoreductase subunit A